MYTTLSIGLGITILGAFLILPFKLTNPCLKIVRRIQRIILDGARRAAFDAQVRDDRSALQWIRIGAGGAAFLFVILLTVRGKVLENDPASLAAVAGNAMVALGASSLLMLGILAFSTFIPRAQGYATLNRCGFQALWIADPQSPPQELKDRLIANLAASSQLAVLDLNGYELIGKGPGPAGGLLYDALDAVRNKPGFVLLCRPNAKDVDPDRRAATVLQNLLVELNISPSAYDQRFAMTISAINALNAARAPDAQIKVRIYKEKPVARAVAFDSTALILPCIPVDGALSPFLEIGQGATEPFLYETFRRHIQRLWGTPFREGSIRPRKRSIYLDPMPEPAAARNPALAQAR